ncbi:arsenosugar biosynthesis radical SAM (seleno)protein ArsS [Candidatus Deferrimicrobium sp.]|uniref:arsenosugar biosynthesis radical SAM (seleno)protein ArsS n=1 Tax=Candidatus Deferrimicrobium sp. TaxID=3060586 RepID=UPI0027219172|nr:arsenosugar biosynthesis radical SAM (seleno)protein ArsS [Candidatus Deferrimicrobium sp.]MDO8738084.1 arsenosugar biosynthesis radical SAM protein ArsS [Candidatus Deferrimicrobium sp.]
MSGIREILPGIGTGVRQAAGVEPFAAALERRGLSLGRGEITTLQVNTGYLCNLRCRHCHLEAGPGRTEIMSRETMAAIVSFAQRFPFQVIDITGGAPELVPDLPFLVEGLAPLAPRLMLRTNLSALSGAARESLLALCVAHRVVLVASFPSTNPSQADAQRGAGVTEAAIAVLKKLNAAGYGVEGTGLELDLVSNPVGAFLPVSQESAERKFRHDLLRKWGVAFNHLYTLANAPLGRFRTWLQQTGNYERYVKSLVEAFNPSAVEGLMCRTLLSVSWDGFLYDCDFNLAAGRPHGDRKVHVSDVRELPPPGAPIAKGDYCYACTAGSGFT